MMTQMMILMLTFLPHCRTFQSTEIKSSCQKRKNLRGVYQRRGSSEVWIIVQTQSQCTSQMSISRPWMW